MLESSESGIVCERASGLIGAGLLEALRVPRWLNSCRHYAILTPQELQRGRGK